jgi:PST family polysaccharide transporter
MIVLARLLDPKDFGLVAMVTVVTGIYGMFTTGGLSSATV